MTQFIATLLAIFIVIPFLSYLLVFTSVKFISGNHKRAVKSAIDSTTFFLFVCIQFMIAEIWGGAFIWFFYIFILIVAILASLYHWRKKEEIQYGQLFKGVWRIHFFVFFVMYITFMVYGMTSSVIGAMS
ncbi:hypothetical protein GCM10008967_22010 [Bacillus carboniphilus]|uniref:DUF3397 domain-containing protein n=1 Tax=Bacillus carboniphilus TaxID=86663 RepID=A0ABN0WAS6_9BACI